MKVQVQLLMQNYWTIVQTSRIEIFIHNLVIFHSKVGSGSNSWARFFDTSSILNFLGICNLSQNFLLYYHLITIYLVLWLFV